MFLTGLLLKPQRALVSRSVGLSVLPVRSRVCPPGLLLVPCGWALAPLPQEGF